MAPDFNAPMKLVDDCEVTELAADKNVATKRKKKKSQSSRKAGLTWCSCLPGTYPRSRCSLRAVPGYCHSPLAGLELIFSRHFVETQRWWNPGYL